ncbi:MAG: OadG family protein [Marinicellaceae bacterium]
MTEIEISNHLFSQAATLLFVGMGFVFAFLSLLIVVIHFFITPLAKRFPDSQLKSNKPSTQQENTAVIAAISAAVSQYRKKHHQK